MANTFELIASSTVGSGGAASIDFTSIPSTFTDLCVKVSIRNVNDTPSVYVRFNGTTTNHSDRWLYGSGSFADSTTNANIEMLLNRSSSTSSTFANAEIYIPNYAGSTNKSVSIDAVSENNGTLAYAQLDAGLWSDTAAITEIKLIAASGNIAQHSTAYLYGVKNA
jgi:hypothetical protein